LNGAAAPTTEFVTPFVLSLVPGKYRLDAENGGVTRPLHEEFEVTAGQAKTVAADMPGFSRDRVVDQILGGSSP
jgi:hypothetical protein